MSATREQIFSALFDLTNNVTWDVGTILVPDVRTFLTRTRRIELFSEVQDAAQPWIGQAEHRDVYAQKSNLPYKREFHAQWMVYHQEGKQPGAVPTIWDNLIVDALEAALAPKIADPGYFDKRNTLSGLVYHCFIEGEVFKDPGDIDNQALIVIPIKLLVP